MNSTHDKSTEQCTCTDHTPSGDKPCTARATHIVEDEDGIGYTCRRHTAGIRDLYDATQLRRLPR